MKKLVLILAALGLLYSCNPEENPSGSEGKEPENNNPKELIVTAEASEVEFTSATLSGYANPSEGMTGVSFGILISEDENPSVDNGQLYQAGELDSNNKFFCKVTNLVVETTYYYKAYLKEGGSYHRGSKTLSFTTKDYEDYAFSAPEAVDLGLNVKWASFNLGASKPEEYGFYYAWGETKPKGDSYTYKWGDLVALTKYCTDSSYGYNGFTDGKTLLDPEDDVAHVKLGGKWRMPTDAEWTDLRNNCTWEWTTMNGIKGRLVTGPNGNSIFFPAAGFRGGTSLVYTGSFGDYWSSLLQSDFPRAAWRMGFDSDYVIRGSADRSALLPVRPVYGELIPVESVSLNKTSLSLMAVSSDQLTVSISPSNATDKTVVWSSSNTSVATVDENGMVVALNEGSATITAKVGDKSADCFVTVTKPSGTNAISVTYYACEVFSSHTDIHIYADNQLELASGYGILTLKQNWASATAVISGVSYPLEATDGASFTDTSNHGKYYWTWAFINTTVSNALSSASAVQPVTVVMTDVQGGIYRFVFTENQTGTKTYYPYVYSVE